jgi:putative flavoprotein involved in K+ transport
MMPATDTVVIGAGQAGLAASHCLTQHGRDHVVLDRGRVGERWRTSTWDSLHLVTPNWMNTLPGQQVDVDDPDGFASAGAFTEQLAGYARSFDAPVEQGADVNLVRQRDHRFEVVTSRGTWQARSVIVATGWCDRPAIPAVARSLSSDVHQIAPSEYRNPDSLPPGGVLVVGASATGVQLAAELRASGRDVSISVGSHTRAPRTYRGMDIFWWLDRVGLLDTTIDEVSDAALARREPSLQLIGRHDRRTVDLATLHASGVRLLGRLAAVDGHRVRLGADLAAQVAAADQQLARVLAKIDRYVDLNGLHDEVLPSVPLSTVVVDRAVRELDLRAAGISTVVWATGYRRSYPWLRVPVLDVAGEIRQRRGRTPVPGLYVLGQRFQYRRSSNFIGGVGRDAAHVAAQIAGGATSRARYSGGCHANAL